MDSPKSGNFPALPPFPRNFRPRNIQNHPKNPKFWGIFSPPLEFPGAFPSLEPPKKTLGMGKFGNLGSDLAPGGAGSRFRGIFPGGIGNLGIFGGKIHKNEGENSPNSAFPTGNSRKNRRQRLLFLLFSRRSRIPFSRRIPRILGAFPSFFGGFSRGFLRNFEGILGFFF